MTIYLHFCEDPHLIWSTNHKEIWIFVKQVTGPFVPSFAIRMYMAFIDTLRSQNTDLQTFKYFMHIIPTKVDPDNLKGCQICNDHINYNLHNIMVVICHKGVLLTINIYFIIIIFEAKFMCLFTFDTNITFFSKYPEINVIDKQ